ncbi:MAG: nickel ABC transporter permease subunit NikB [Epulopiscium sp. Nuni2H_MBin003]|nr:MAG: nickel ABC transporter permease subunit NikB [Epulopiscium sp. Nuni2H_MBin003]
MNKYILKRTIAIIPLLFAISIFTFVFINLIPVDPAEVVLRLWNIPVASEELIAQTREDLGLNDPYVVRYFNWLADALRFDFGVSYATPQLTVAQKLAAAFPNTLQLASLSFVLVIVISLPIGFLCAVYKDSWFDKLMRAFIFLTTAMPSYWIGLVLMWVISVKLGWLPTSGNFNGFKSLILPSITVASSYISIFIRLIRNNMIENMTQDYVHYANVRGLKQMNILVKHILKNSLHTCVVAIGMSIPQLISGTIVVENVFAWPGLGTLCISSVFARDMPVIQAYVLLVGVLFVVFNLIFDILQGVMDPKLRVGGEKNA